MKKIYASILLFCFLLQFAGLVFAQKPKKIRQYNSCDDKAPQPESLPCFFTDLNNCLSKKEIEKYSRHLRLESFDYYNCVSASAKATPSELKKKPNSEDARVLAFNNCIEQVLKQYSDWVTTVDFGGSSTIDINSLQNSFFRIVTTSDSSGLAPLTILKQDFSEDLCPSNYGINCYMLCYLDRKDLERRLNDYNKKQLNKSKIDSLNFLVFDLMTKNRNLEDQILDYSNKDSLNSYQKSRSSIKIDSLIKNIEEFSLLIDLYQIEYEIHNSNLTEDQINERINKFGDNFNSLFRTMDDCYIARKVYFFAQRIIEDNIIKTDINFQNRITQIYNKCIY